MKKPKLVVLVLLIFIGYTLSAQLTFVDEKTPTFYFEGTQEPPIGWQTANFDHSAWKTADASVIGFGYGDEGYIKINSSATSLYIRCPFTVENIENIGALNLLVDYDDGYIAYLNGQEVARVNISSKNQFPTYNETAVRSHYSEYAYGLTKPVLGIYLNEGLVDTCLRSGENVLAIQIVDDSLNQGMLVIPALVNLNATAFNIWSDLSRYKQLVKTDSTNLPLMAIETDALGVAYNQSIWTIAQMKLISNENNFLKPSDTANEYEGLISIRMRGQSSRDFAKKSYRFELVDENHKDTTVTLLGMPKESDWILTANYTDKSQIRNKMIYDLGAKLQGYTPRTRFIELIINGQNEGLYLLSEQIKRDKNRVNISKIKETDVRGYDVTGGYIFKIDKTDQNSKTRIHNREIVYPDTLVSEQMEYLDKLFYTFDSVLMTNDFADPEIGFRRYASDTSLIDFLIINEITKNADAYKFSTYFHKDRDDKDGRIKFGPIWDYDLGFGNSIFQDGHKIEGWQWEVNKTMKLTRYLQDTKLVEQLQERYWELRNSVYSNDSIFNYMNLLLDQIEFVRKRNYEVWPIISEELFGPGYYVDSYEAEIEYMHYWISERLNWIDSNINQIFYEVQHVSVEDITKITFSAYPNPFTDELKVSFESLEEGTTEIELHNLAGQKQLTLSFQTISGINEFNLNNGKLDNMPSGVYLLKLTINNKYQTYKKVIKR